MADFLAAFAVFFVEIWGEIWDVISARKLIVVVALVVLALVVAFVFVGHG